MSTTQNILRYVFLKLFLNIFTSLCTTIPHLLSTPNIYLTLQLLPIYQFFYTIILSTVSSISAQRKKICTKHLFLAKAQQQEQKKIKERSRFFTLTRIVSNLSLVEASSPTPMQSCTVPWARFNQVSNSSFAFTNSV